MNATDGGALLVLIAEDDATTRRLLERTVEKWGYRPLVAPDGVRAWEILRSLPVHILITDWDMPGMSGLDLCQQMRSLERERYTYTLMLTHHDNRARMLQAIDAGADDFVSKPFHPLELQARLKVASRIVNLESRLRKTQRRLESMNVQLAKEATTDTLMGVGNRRAFDTALERAHAWALEQGLAYGVAMCDVDFFKGYNDTYGHQAGDKVLATIGRLLQDLVRGGDDVFRYGGEEIVVLLPRCSPDGLLLVGERLRRSVESLAMEHSESPVGVVTVSIGGALFEPDEQPVPTAGQIVQRADDALYRAKRSGRNRVETSPEP
jgi:two-component system chemotaxis response regulator CheY